MNKLSLLLLLLTFSIATIDASYSDNYNINYNVLPVCNESWDVNRDGIIDIRDIVIVGQHFGQTTSPPYPSYDVNGDGIVDIRDIVIVGQHFGQATCWK